MPMDEALMGDDSPASSAAPALSYNAPHIPDRCKAGLAAANAGRVLAPFATDPTPILARLYDGERPVDVAKDLGVSHQGFYAFLLRNCPEEWKAISAGRGLARMETAEEDMVVADDNVKIGRARELHRQAAWHLERVSRPIYGDDKNQSGITVQVLVQRDGVTFEGGQ